jgi:membrane protein
MNVASCSPSSRAFRGCRRRARCASASGKTGSGLTASSLTFTTTIALVPIFTVALALFTAFPMFARCRANLQQWLVQSLVPDTIARQVLGYLTQFSGKASRLGAVGFTVLF